MRALIVGHRGQDGRLLLDHLETQGYTVAGLGRDSIDSNSPEGKGLPPPPQIDQPGLWGDWIESFQPDEIYYLAAWHRSSEGESSVSLREELALSRRTHVDGPAAILEAIARHRPRCRFFYASSSLVFGDPETAVQNEDTPLRPTEVYGMTKAMGTWVCHEYRRRHGVFASVGILYNHESAFRKPHFLTQKVIQSALRLASGSSETLTLGSLESAVDWGYAPDFVRAFHLILRAEEPEDYIVATGEKHTVGEFVEIVFDYLNLDWRQHVREDPSLLKRVSQPRIGDASRLRTATGWEPTLNFTDFIHRLVDDTRELTSAQAGR